LFFAGIHGTYSLKAERAHNAAQRRAVTWQASPRLVKVKKEKRRKKKEAWQ
jgi:hypothetical protein